MSNKTKQSGNALKHGVYSRALLFPGESQEEYEALHSELCEEWAPAGPTEKDLVDRLTKLLWKQRRLDVYSEIELQHQIEQNDSKNATAKDFRRILRLVPKLANATTYEEVERLFAEVGHPADVITKAVPKPPPDKESEWGAAIAAYLDNVPRHRVPQEAHTFAVFVQTSIDGQIAEMRSSRIQEDIDRTIKRLIQVKASKQLLANPRALSNSKLIDVSPNTAIAQKE